MTDLTQELISLKEYFESTDLPTEPLKINRYMTVHDVRQFIVAQIKKINNYSGPEAGRDREFTLLRELKATLEKLKNE